jgi:N-acetylglutamate synthase-like GNAT family acetyltransferase
MPDGIPIHPESTAVSHSQGETRGGEPGQIMDAQAYAAKYAGENGGTPPPAGEDGGTPPPAQPGHSGYLIAPTPQVGVLSRATLSDLSFIDSLQKKFGRSLGFLPTAALEVNLEAGNVDLCLENGEPAGYLLCRPRLAWQPLLGSIVQAAVAMDAQRRHHGLALLLQVEERAIKAGQIALQANCAVGVEANEFWATSGFKPIAHLTPATKSGREIICWRKPLTRKLPAWFLDLPKAAGGRGLRVNSTRNLNRASKDLDFAAKFASGKILVAGDPTHQANGYYKSVAELKKKEGA